MRRLAQIVVALLLCLMAGQPLAAALIASGGPEMACCRKGKGAHACCKRKANAAKGPTLTSSSHCASSCCCKLALSTEKPFEALHPSPLHWPVLASFLPASGSPDRFTASHDRTQWQRPPPASRRL